MTDDAWISVQAAFNFGEDSEVQELGNHQVIDGTANAFFNVAPGVFPWKLQHPAVNRTWQCVVTGPTTMTQRIFHLGWRTENCSNLRGYVCRKPCQPTSESQRAFNEMLNAPELAASLVFVTLTLFVALIPLTRTVRVARQLQASDEKSKPSRAKLF